MAETDREDASSSPNDEAGDQPQPQQQPEQSALWIIVLVTSLFVWGCFDLAFNAEDNRLSSLTQRPNVKLFSICI